MAYVVTFDDNPQDRAAPVGIDMAEPGPFDLAEALVHANQLLIQGYQHVTISDDHGHAISGEDLIACCEGRKTLTPDLKAS